MKCNFCSSDLFYDKECYIYICGSCNINYNFGDYGVGFFRDEIIEDSVYTVAYYPHKNETILFKNELIICSLDGAVNPCNLFKRLKIMKVFS